MSYYSQNDEERFIGEWFSGRRGRFLDVGAFDGKSLSNTWRLLELGWHGVLVEPAPHNFLALMENSKPYRERTQLVQAAVCADSRLTRFWMDTIPDRKWSNTVSYDLVKSGSVMAPVDLNLWVQTCTLLDLEPLGPYDFVSLDAEWEDMAILEVFPETMLRRLELLCIEPREGQRPAMTSLLVRRGLRVVYETPENILAAQS